MTNPTEAAWAETMPNADGDSRYWAVGKPIWLNGKHGATVTRITVQEDLSGLYGNLRRVCVWAGDILLAEAPVHNLQAIGYPHD